MSTTSGWGRCTWGQANWNEATTFKTGWGAQAWNDGEWGNLANETVTLTGLQANTSVGSVTFDLTSIISFKFTIFEGCGGFFNQVNSLIEIEPSYLSSIITKAAIRLGNQSNSLSSLNRKIKNQIKE